MSNIPMEDDKGRTIAVVGLATKYVSTTLTIAGTTNYAAGDVVSNSASAGTYLTFSNVVKQAGGSGKIVGAIALSQSTQITFQPTLFLFHTAPVSSMMNDNVASTAPHWSDRTYYAGEIDFPSFSYTTGGARAEVVEGEGKLPKKFKCAGGDTNLYGIVKTETAETSEVASAGYLFILLIEHDS